MRTKELTNRQRGVLQQVALGLGAALFWLVPSLRAECLLQPNDVVAICAAVRPGPQMISVDIADYLLMCQPVAGIRIIQSCLFEESVEVFMKRVESDLEPWHPSVVLTAHGAESGNNLPDSRGATFYYPTYLGKTVDLVKQIGSRVNVIGSFNCVDSFYFHNNPAEAQKWNENLAAFRDKNREVTQSRNVNSADIYDLMMDAMSKAKAAFGEEYVLGGLDGIHPDANGQLIMAYAFLKKLGCDGAIGAITVDLASGKANGTPGHQIISCQNGTVEIESARYPFCFKGAPEKPESTSGIIKCFPFNDDLNRYILVVKGLRGARTKIMWGNESREFSNSDLEKGVNLAAAFAAHTPFDAQFHKVESAIWEQQRKHQLFFSFFHNLGKLKEMAPDSVPALDQLAAGIIKQDKENAAAAAALVVPIRHTVKIEEIP